jgi:hypothetical protein
MKCFFEESISEKPAYAGKFLGLYPEGNGVDEFAIKENVAKTMQPVNIPFNLLFFLKLNLSLLSRGRAPLLLSKLLGSLLGSTFGVRQL